MIYQKLRTVETSGLINSTIAGLGITYDTFMRAFQVTFINLLFGRMAAENVQFYGMNIADIVGQQGENMGVTSIFSLG